MTETIGIWWRGRTLREQRLLGLMFGLLFLLLAWLLVVRPLDDALAAARERHGAAVIALAEAKVRAAEIDRLQKQAPAGAMRPAMTIVNESAVGAGFAIRSLDEVGAGAVRLVLDSVRPQAFFGWVAEMEGQGLVVVQLTARPNADRTLAAEVTFRPRRA
jgi:general secretion pathway protein M